MILKEKLVEFVKKKKILVVVFGILLILLVGLVDYFTGYELGISIVYLMPIFFTTWYAGKTGGIFITIISTLVWTTADLLAGKPYSSIFVPFWNILARSGLFLVFVSLVNRYKSVLDDEKKKARIDFKTGIYNSQYFYELAAVEIERSKRYKSHFTVAFIDCDNFKTVNDIFGHQSGDDLLLLIADTIKKNIRIFDIFARLGGDEFIILFPETDQEFSLRIINELRDILSKAIRKNEYSVTFSIGIVTFLEIPQNVDEMIKKADGMMYIAKKDGKNMIKCEVYGK